MICLKNSPLHKNTQQQQKKPEQSGDEDMAEDHHDDDDDVLAFMETYQTIIMSYIPFLGCSSFPFQPVEPGRGGGIRHSASD